MSWDCLLMQIQWWCLFSHQTNQFWKFRYLTHVHMIYTSFFNMDSMIMMVM